MSNANLTEDQANLCGEHEVFRPTEQPRRNMQKLTCSCGLRFSTRTENPKCSNCRALEVHPLALSTSQHHAYNAFLSSLEEDTLSNLMRLNTRHSEVSAQDKATTARLVYDTLLEDLYFREHGKPSARSFDIRKRFHAWLNPQLNGSFRMPLALYFADARIVIGVQLGEHTPQQ